MTIKEIAKLCGVSRGTVDRVLNNRGKVKPETEALILKTICEHGYTKNIVGRALTVKKTSPVIGIILCSEGNPFFDDVIAGFHAAQEELRDYGATIILKTMCGHEVARQLDLIDELAEGISALVIQPINSRRIAARLCSLKESGIPVVTVNTDIESSSRCCYVGSNYESGGAVAAGLLSLVTNGSAKLGIIEGVHTLMGHVLRQKGFEDHLLKISPGILLVDRAPALDDPEQAYRATCHMLQTHPEIDTIFVVAAGVYDVCRAIIDCRREQSIRVVAYDDVPSTREMMRRGLVRAVVCQQPFEQGYRAVHEAFDMLLSGQMQENGMRIMENQIKIAENID
ncbi:MAG: LacI family DNA-binding transcriptional regulator [Clostridia bacterium]|nr:LacI family DNA-binding transcriptional regulator [Clostridia bacterium]